MVNLRLALLLTAGVVLGAGVWAASAWLFGPAPEGRSGVVRADDGTLVLPADLVAHLQEQASPAELEVLADGSITPSEYVLTVDVTLDCLRGEGFRVVHYPDQRRGVFIDRITTLASAADGPYQDARGIIEYGATGGGPSVEENARVVEVCKRNSALIERLWIEHAGPEKE